VLPANVSDIGSMIALATKVYEGAQPPGNTSAAHKAR
jgi:hypothetical protein